MEMQDNEFDEIFRSKLDGFEAEPSAKVWTGVKAGLNADKRKRMLVPILSIAASIVVLVAAGILFFPKEQYTSDKHNVQNKIAKAPKTLITAPIVKNKSNPAISKSDQIVRQNASTAPINTIAALHQLKKAEDIPANQPSGMQLPGLNNDQQSLASLNEKQHDEIKNIVPDTGTILVIKPPVNETPVFLTKPVLYAAQLPVAARKDTTRARAKRGIHSIGDLINVVVAKVDKRKDKFVEFTDIDGDQSTITGVNLGIVKIKKGE